MEWRARGRAVEFPRRPLVMGIVNINDDSFCGDGTLDVRRALALAEDQLTHGADVIDIGAESARTNRAAISAEEESARLLPFLARWRELVAKFVTPPFDGDQLWPPLLSINTWRAGVIARVLPHGGEVINDMSALPGPENAALCAEHGAGLVIMHSVGEPKVKHTHVRYGDVMAELDAFFEAKLALAVEAGMDERGVILDPGIDFAKQREDNLSVYKHLDKLRRHGRPILLPVSRKTVIGEVLGITNAVERDAGTMACLAAGMRRGAQIFRVHNVRAAAQAVKALWAVLGGSEAQAPAPK